MHLYNKENNGDNQRRECETCKIVIVADDKNVKGTEKGNYCAAKFRRRVRFSNSHWKKNKIRTKKTMIHFNGRKEGVR